MIEKKKPHEYGVGEDDEGNVNIFPPEQLQERLAELRRLEREAEGDDLSDLDGVVDLYGGEGEKK